MTKRKTLITVQIPHFGGCPRCHRNNGLVQIYNGDWGVCHVHRTMWLESASGWATGTGHTKKQWAKIAARFRHYEEAEPVWEPGVTGKALERIQEPGVLCGLPDSIREAIGQLVDYVWERESASYAKLTTAKIGAHIFRFAAVVCGWLNGLAEQNERESPDDQQS